MPRGMSRSNVIDGYNNLLEEYKSLEKENKSLRNKLYKPEKTIFHKRNETNPDVSTWNHGFLAGFSAAFIGTYLGMIFSHYYY
tara:strand:+ start:359 stop:607 length:249 start_codon:yes stop_codon:yes gene_type:complete